MDSSNCFSVIYEDETGAGWTYAIDDSKYPEKEEVVARQLLLLGYHIVHVAKSVGVEPPEAAQMAIGLASGYSVGGDGS